MPSVCPELVGTKDDRPGRGCSYMWTTGLGPALLSVALSASCPSTDLQLYKEAPVFQKVGAGSLTGAKGQAGTAVP